MKVYFILGFYFLGMVSTVAAGENAAALEKEAMRLKAEERYVEATPFLERALELKTQRYGPQDAFTGSTALALAEVYDKQSRYEEAMPLYEQGLAILEQPNYPNYEQVAAVLEAMAEIETARGNDEKAGVLKAKAEESREKKRKILESLEL